jgi:phage replication O-like protein O
MLELMHNILIPPIPVHRMGGSLHESIEYKKDIEMAKKLSPPNYTQIPNDILDNINKFTHTEFKIISFMCRKTFGWHKKRDRIAYSQLTEGTGLGRTTVIRDVKRLISKGFLRQSGGVTRGYSYEIQIDGECPDMTPTVSPGDTLKPIIVSPGDTTKEFIKTSMVTTQYHHLIL